MAGTVPDHVGRETGEDSAGRHALRKRNARAIRWVRVRESFIQKFLVDKIRFHSKLLTTVFFIMQGG